MIGLLFFSFFVFGDCYVCWSGDGSDVAADFETGRDHAFSGRPCDVWNKRAYGSDYFADYSHNHRHCLDAQPHFEEYGPWCFVKAGSWEPCYPSCHLDPPCLWLRDLPMAPNSYMGLRDRDTLGRPCSVWTFTGQDGLCSEGDRRCRVPWEGMKMNDKCTNTSGEVPAGPVCQVKVEEEEGRMTLSPCFPTCEVVAQCVPRKLKKTFNYLGFQNRSISGRTCLNWAADEKGNYCRNPTGNLFTGPYCKVSKKADGLEPCLPECEDYGEDVEWVGRKDSKIGTFQCGQYHCVKGDKMLGYRGHCMHTLSGTACQAWGELVPHGHTINASDLGVHEPWEVANFCRNPDAKPGGPWCFTTDPMVRWEYCFPLCSSPEAIHRRTINESYWAREEAVIQDPTTTTPNSSLSKTPLSLGDWVGQLEWNEQNSRYVGWAALGVAGLLLLYIASVLANYYLFEMCSLEREEVCCCIRGQLRLMKRTIEMHPPPPAASKATNEAYVIMVTQFKRLRNVARHSWTGTRREGWEEFELLNIRQDVEAYHDSSSSESESSSESTTTSDLSTPSQTSHTDTDNNTQLDTDTTQSDNAASIHPLLPTNNRTM